MILVTNTSDKTRQKAVCVCSHLPIGPQPNPVMYVAANPVRGLLLDRKRSEEHLQMLQREHENKNKTKTKTTKIHFLPLTGGCSEGLDAFKHKSHAR